MKANITVSVRTGYYVVTVIDQRLGLRTYSVDKQKRCSCGGTAKRPCCHIQAVAAHLLRGGRRAPEKDPMLRVRETRQGSPPSGGPAPLTCPICGEPVEKQDLDFWRCPKDTTHYWQWRGEQTGVKSFLTQSHPAKSTAFHSMTQEEREAFLDQAARRMHLGGYTPYG